jgi:hypothetical protein
VQDTTSYFDVVDGVSYFLEGSSLELCDNISITSSLVAADAFPEHESCAKVQHDSVLLPEWQKLVDLGLVASCSLATVEYGFRLTGLGVSALRYGEVLGPPKSAFQPRCGIELKDRTTLECICLLDAAGFEWRLLPRKVCDREGLKYCEGGERYWYSAGTTVSAWYPCRCKLVLQIDR